MNFSRCHRRLESELFDRGGLPCSLSLCRRALAFHCFVVLQDDHLLHLLINSRSALLEFFGFILHSFLDGFFWGDT